MEPTEQYSSGFEMCLWFALVLPLCSFILSIVINEKFEWLASLSSTFLMLVSAALSIFVGTTAWDQEVYHITWSWLKIGGSPVQVGLLLNNLSLLMLMVVTVISFLVHLYSLGYMAGDAASKRYFGMLGLFTFSMLGIIVSDNLLAIFVFWELVGFSSYMLIGHWNEKIEAAMAAKKAFIFNRIGDAGFMIGLMILWTHNQSFSLVGLEAPSGVWHTVASLCLFCGVIGKSAQFPLFTWLPDAMEGPTPVSALIHAATMVAAGVFLLARVEFLFSPHALLVIATIGIITSLLAALSAIVQTDIKKILAYSTVSQLGLMITAAGAGAPEAAILHLFTHAFFKACLFLCAGSIIHALHLAQHHQHVHFDVQDIRNLGGLRRKLPFTFIAMVLSGSALAGIPMFSGFLSKEAIFTALNTWRGNEVNLRWIIFALAFLVTALTVLYTFRLISRIFLGDEKMTRQLSVKEPPMIMRAPVALLAIFSLWFVASWHPLDFSGWLIQDSSHSSVLTWFSIGWILLFLALALLLFRKDINPSSHFVRENYYLDTLYNAALGRPVLALAEATNHADRNIFDRMIHAVAYVHVLISHLTAWFDRAIIDGIANGAAYLARLVGSFTRSFQGGKIQLYVFWTAFTIIIFLIWSLI